MPRRKQLNDLAALGWLAAESAAVIQLRLLKLALGGPKAKREARRMVSEKVLAAGSATRTLMTGGSPGQVVSGYRKRVRANRRRLSGGG
ncbi:hypothetical protein [Enterovirga sp. CN4-39]|uniref:hypothetical protein n=1 Tax=Enterovirga sp. CN4-39 TaxID=3400910 RepID=UPI003C122C61